MSDDRRPRLAIEDVHLIRGYTVHMSPGHGL